MSDQASDPLTGISIRFAAQYDVETDRPSSRLDTYIGAVAVEQASYNALYASALEILAMSPKAPYVVVENTEDTMPVWIPGMRELTAQEATEPCPSCQEPSRTCFAYEGHPLCLVCAQAVSRVLAAHREPLHPLNDAYFQFKLAEGEREIRASATARGLAQSHVAKAVEEFAQYWSARAYEAAIAAGQNKP